MSAVLHLSNLTFSRRSQPLFDHLNFTIRHGDRMFQVKDMGRGMHAVIEIAPKMLPPDHAPASLDLLKKMNLGD